jgi:hypothetical protein
MDLFCSPWSDRTKAWVDAFTDLLRGELIQCDSFYLRNNDLPGQLIWYNLHFFFIPDSGEVVVESNYADVKTQDLIYTERIIESILTFITNKRVYCSERLFSYSR